MCPAATRDRSASAGLADVTTLGFAYNVVNFEAGKSLKPRMEEHGARGKVSEFSRAPTIRPNEQVRRASRRGIQKREGPPTFSQL